MATKQAYELWSEAVRDIGILLLVFAPLDTLLKSGYGSAKDWLIGTGVAVLGVLLLFAGVKLGFEE